ncbi:caspase family protein [Leptolyngbya sp. CCNP1308]|uniref:caspase family protein n=1 Tax=Leptolyngbya sp. CCNP1308 TaxID=3110255 RepID=UPI002B2024E2|nr:caspase family protein [Leptolyngbya sp. CCNP1308]MEA5451410.1 caspase family protein [Leptolyngbya sp. CCNP1308]
MTLKRRAFLQQASLALGALGLGGGALLASPSQYQQALAKPARRKLALLIGINTYPDRALDPGVAQDIALKGCVTDVELQRQLLVYRFGFQPAEVVTLTNQEATRSNILTAIDEHLVQQAQADDVVVLHFSGYGSQVRVVEADDRSSLQAAWVTVDSRLPSETNPALGDLLEAEVVAHLSPLATANLTTVIDAGSQDAGYLHWGNSRVRSRPTVPTGLVSFPEALSTPWPGLVLRAAEMGRLVLESQWEGFSAGVFTYALTQSLWEMEPDSTARVLMQRAGSRLQRWVGADQQPALSDRRPPRIGPMAYGLPPQLPPAAGVILPTREGRPLAAWLGGVPPQVLRYLQPGSRLVAGTGDRTVLLRLETRTGLKASVKSLDGEVAPATLAHQPLFEQVRRLPQTIDLIVALDSHLDRVERVDATSALASIPLVTSVTAGERAADCLFGRLPIGPVATLTAALPSTAETQSKLGGERPAESSYGLFAPNRTLLPGTMLAKEEAVKTAVNRLTPYLQTLLALKLVRLTENHTASQVGAAALLEAVQPKPMPLLVKTTEHSSTVTWPLAIRQAQKSATDDPIMLPRDGRIGYRLANVSTQSLHLLWMSFDSRGECTALMTLPDAIAADGAEVPTAATPLEPGQLITFPADGAGWAMPGAATWVESHVILSTQPLERCLAVLGNDPPSLATGFRPVPQPLELAQALLQDLSASPDDYAYALHHDRWATLSFRYTLA